MTEKKQVVVVHGGDAYRTYDDYIKSLYAREITQENVDRMTSRTKGWKEILPVSLGDEYEVIAPKMPCGWNAKYKEWEIWFKKYLPFLRENVILVGHSMGAIFLAKYLVENEFPVRVAQLHLVGAPIEDATSDDVSVEKYSLYDFNFADVEKLRELERKVEEIVIYHSEDDPVVPFKDSVAYAYYLENAEFVRFLGRGHFLQADFPELVERILR